MTTSSHSMDALTPKEEVVPKSPTQNQPDSSPVLSAMKLDGQMLHDAVLKQIEWYFSRQNLSTDSFLLSQMNSQKYVPISLIANFPKIKNLTDNIEFITNVMKHSKILTVNENGTLVRPIWTTERTTLILRDLNVASIDEIRQIFAVDSTSSTSSTNQQSTSSTVTNTTEEEDLKKPSSSSSSNTTSSTPTSPSASSSIKLRFHITNIRADVVATYFITFQNEDECLKAADFLSTQTHKGKPIRFRVKSENLFRSYFNPNATSPSSISPYPNIPGPVMPSHSPGGYPVSNIGMGNPVGNVNTGMQSIPSVSPAFQHQWGPVHSPISSNFFFGYMPPVAPPATLQGHGHSMQFPRAPVVPGISQPPIIMVMPPSAQAPNQINHSSTGSSNSSQGRVGGSTAGTTSSVTDSGIQHGSGAPSPSRTVSSPVSTSSGKSLENGRDLSVKALNTNARGNQTGENTKDINSSGNSDFSSAGSQNRNANGNKNASHKNTQNHTDDVSNNETGPREQNTGFNRDRQGAGDRRIRRGANSASMNRSRDMHPQRKYKTKLRYGMGGTRLQPNFGPEHFPPLPSSGKHYTAKNPHSTHSQVQQQKPKNQTSSNVANIVEESIQQNTSQDTQSPSYASMATNMSSNKIDE